MRTSDEMVFIECRCKDCDWSEPRNDFHCLCKRLHRRVSPDGFCCVAKRRKEKEE